MRIKRKPPKTLAHFSPHTHFVIKNLKATSIKNSVCTFPHSWYTRILHKTDFAHIVPKKRKGDRRGMIVKEVCDLIDKLVYGDNCFGERKRNLKCHLV